MIGGSRFGGPLNDFRFQVLGFPVTVQPGFAILVGIYMLFGLQAQRPLWTSLSFAAVVFVSILVHELGHAVTARRLGLRVGGIFIHGFGGHVTHSRGPAARQLLVSLAGPGAGLLLGIPLLIGTLVLDPHGSARIVLEQAVFVNVVWSLFNLLPMLPLDGGNALGSLLEVLVGPARGWNVATTVGVVCGAAIALLALSWGQTFIMFLGGYCAWHSLQVRRAWLAA